MVASRSVVLPAPGELTRFSARISRPLNQARLLRHRIVLGQDAGLEGNDFARGRPGAVNLVVAVPMMRAVGMDMVVAVLMNMIVVADNRGRDREHAQSQDC